MSTGDEIWLSGLRPSTVYLVNVAAVNVVGVGQSLQFAFTTDNLRQLSPLLKLTLTTAMLAPRPTAGCCHLANLMPLPVCSESRMSTRSVVTNVTQTQTTTNSTGPAVASHGEVVIRINTSIPVIMKD